MTEQKEQIVESLAEVNEPKIKYILRSNPKRWLQIDTIRDCPNDPEEYCINGPFGLYTFITHGNRVRTWKTLKGAIRFLRKKSVDGSIGLGVHEWATEEDKVAAAKSQKEAEEKRQSDMEERKQRWNKKMAETEAFAEFLKEIGLEILTENVTTHFMIKYKGMRFEVNHL